MYNSQELDEIRKNIDSLDNNIHDLLMERADLIDKISAAKKKQNMQIVQPAREAQMIRRLLARHQGPLPQEAIIRIWRELVGAVCMLQTGLSFAVYSPENNPEYGDVAKDYFGSVLPMTRTKTIAGSIALIKEGKVDFAVFPCPQMQEDEHWWKMLFDVECDNLKIIIKLPYEKDKNQHTTNALIVGRNIDFSPSENDNSFIAIEISADNSKSGILDKIQNAKLEVLSIYSTEIDGKNFRKFLIEVKGYLSEKSESFEKIKEIFDDEEVKVKLIGGYPVIPVCEYK